MVNPEASAQFTLKDLKRSKMAFLFIDMLINLNKFAMHEQKNPLVIEEIRSTPNMTDWDRFASAEYQRYAEEDAEKDEDDTDELCQSTSDEARSN